MRRTALVALTVAAAAVPAAAAYPPRDDVRSAIEYAKQRQGSQSVALIDTRGRRYDWNATRPYLSASVTKAMLLVAYLRRIGARLPSREERRLLGPMITRSGNRQAKAIYRRVGDPALRRLARRAAMRRFFVAGSWAGAWITAGDLARFMLRFDRLTPRRSRGYARRLMRSIVPRQRWGFSRYAERSGWQAYFKGGWRRLDGRRLLHEAAMFERGGRRFAVVVLSTGSPSHRYAAATLRAVARRVFESGPAVRARAAAGKRTLARAGLRDVRRYAPRIAFDLRYATRRNLTGRRLPGYCRRWPLLRRAAARDLARVERALNRRGLGLKLLDAYRPARASRALVRWAYRTGRGHLVGTYLARRSRHNTGSAVDLTLVSLRDGRGLKMGTRYDHLGPRAHTYAVGGRLLRNRLLLKRAMERRGFRGYRREWWHFEHRLQGRRHLDLTLGCKG